jgi:hypothetical protein
MAAYTIASNSVVSTDDDDETTQPIDQVENQYPDDEEFDPYESGLNDFTFDDAGAISDDGL